MKINRWKLLIVAAVVSIATGACTDERDNFMVDDTISLVHTNQLINVSVYQQEYQLAVLKNGKGRQEATVDLTISEAALTEYNTTNSTNYVLMPENCYKLPQSIKFSKGDARQFADITWDYSAIFALDENKSYVIPVQISVSNDALALDATRNLLIINPKRASMTVQSNPVKISDINSQEAITANGKIDLDASLLEDLTVNYVIDNTLIATYNSAHGTSFVAAPEGYATLTASSVQIAKGETSAMISCKFNPSKLNLGNELAYALVPVRITSLSIDGIGMTENTVYFPVVYEPTQTFKGPWTLLEGVDNCYARDPKAPGWASGYTADKLFDGEVTMGHEWISQWEKTADNPIPFPMTFVVDMGESHLITNFITADYTTHSGQYRDFRFYTAETYDGANTQWVLAADVHTDFSWSAEVKYYNSPASKIVAGRYLKVEIVKPSFELSNTEYIGGRGKMADIQGMGF